MYNSKDCGQKLIGVVQCHECGMAYSHGDPADTATHNKYHTRLSADLKFPVCVSFLIWAVICLILFNFNCIKFHHRLS